MKGTAIKISVVIPTYKPQNYVWECLDSMVSQTLSRDVFEVIVVLNGCCEPWQSEMTAYIEQKMRGMQVVFVQTDQPGVSNARNIALDRARGEYVTFIDDDDFVSPSYLEELLKKATPDTISLCYPYAFNDGAPDIQLPYALTDAYEYGVSRDKVRLTSKVRKYFSGPCMKLIPMSFIQDRRFDVRFKNGEDSLFMLLISDKFKSFSFTKRNAIYYRRWRPNSACLRKRDRKEKILNDWHLVRAYFSIYIRKPCSYSFAFFLTRVLGTMLGDWMERIHKSLLKQGRNQY